VLSVRIGAWGQCLWSVARWASRGRSRGEADGWGRNKGCGSIPQSRVALVGLGPESWESGVLRAAWPIGAACGRERLASRGFPVYREAFAPPDARGVCPLRPVAAPPKCEWLRLRTVQRSEVAVQKNSKLRFRQGADLARDHGAVLEQHQGRYAAHRVLGGGRRILVHVQLGDLDAAVVVAGDLVEDRRDHLARATPFGPVVDEHGGVRLQHVLVERVVANLLDCHLNSLDIGAPASGGAARNGARSLPVNHQREVTTAASASPALLECPRAGLPASRRGEPGQVRKEAAIVIHRGCRGSGSPTDAVGVTPTGGPRPPRRSLRPVSTHGTSGTGSEMAPA